MKTLRSSLALLSVVAAIWQCQTPCEAEEDAYAALRDIITVTSKIITASDCSVNATVDFERYTPRLGLFRDAWLNRDFSVDFYNQRRKQIFLYVIVKRAAELLTLGLYSNASLAPSPDCAFKIDIKSFDKSGQPNVYPAVTWHFNRAQSGKVAWSTVDPRNFQDIAIDYRIATGMDDWVSDEPNMAGKENSKSANVSNCDERFLRANAIFIRATTFCKRDYMDTRAGYFALAMFKRCSNLAETELMPKIKAAMAELDQVIVQKGKSLGCHWVDELEHSVESSIPR
jgi:hypothetical protein